MNPRDVIWLLCFAWIWYNIQQVHGALLRVEATLSSLEAAVYTRI